MIEGTNGIAEAKQPRMVGAVRVAVWSGLVSGCFFVQIQEVQVED